MAYLEEFSIHVANGDLARFLQLWEEYCASDSVDANELRQILELLAASDLADGVGPYVEAALPLWSMIEEPNASYDILRLILDLQTNNSDVLCDTTYEFLKAHYGDQKFFGTKIRLIGLRDRNDFRRAITNYELLSHMDKGKFVFHKAGWGTGEIMEISLVREELLIEFENVMGAKNLTFENAFRTLVPIDNSHFLARRFSDPDALEAEARKDPVKVLKGYLKDLGSNTAAEIKEDFLELVIPQEDWSKWWQSARSRLKKDTYVIPPSNVKEPFRLRTAEVSHEEQLEQALAKAQAFDETLLTSYNFVRDLPDMLKNEELKGELVKRFSAFLDAADLTLSEHLQAAIFLESFCQKKIPERSVQNLVQEITDAKQVVDAIPIVAFKKRTLSAIRDYRDDWVPIFLDMLFVVQPSALRDYLLKELQSKDTIQALEEAILDLLTHPTRYPEAFVWYFQKATSKRNVPFSDDHARTRFFEAFLTLFHTLDAQDAYRDLSKKMYNLLIASRWKLVRDLLEGSSIEFCREVVLLASKCQAFSTHDMKILRSLTQVVYPELGEQKEEKSLDPSVVWTTEEGYHKLQERIRTIGEEEIIDNAREIEVARSHGDLRENAEYKFALERRDRLQAELKMLSDQIQRARILAPDDIATGKVCVGAIVDLRGPDEAVTSYTILGPWDADPENNILSYQSKFAEAMIGLKPGDRFSFKDSEYEIVKVESFMEQKTK